MALSIAEVLEEVGKAKTREDKRDVCLQWRIQSLKVLVSAWFLWTGLKTKETWSAGP